MFIHDFGPIKIMNEHSSSIKNKIIEYISSYLFTELFSHVLVTTIDNITYYISFWTEYFFAPMSVTRESLRGEQMYAQNFQKLVCNAKGRGSEQ